MTSPLDEKGLDAAREAYEAAFPDAWGGITYDGMEAAIRAYLSVSHPIGDGMEVWGYHVRRLTDEGAQLSQSLRFGPEQTSPTNIVTPLVSGPEAAALIAAKDARIAIAERNRDAARDNFHTMQQAAAKLAGKLETAEAQVKRLTEDNEALRKALEALVDQADHVTAGARTSADINKAARNLFPLCVAARAILTQENADGQ